MEWCELLMGVVGSLCSREPFWTVFYLPERWKAKEKRMASKMSS